MSSTPTPPSMPSEAPTSSPSPSLPRQPCRYLTSPGGCRYGDACRFIHPTDVLQQQSHQQQHPSQMQSQMQPHMPIPMQPSHIPLQQQQQSQDPSSQSSPPPVQMAYPSGYPFYSPNEMNFEEGQTPYMYPPPPPHTQQHININMPPSPYQTPTPTHFPSPSLTPSPYQGPHLPPPYQASPSLQPFPATANSTYPQPPPQQLTPYQMYAYQYQQQQLIPYMQNAAHAYAAAGYTPQQQQQMLHQLAMSLQMMPPMNPPMEQRTMHLTRRDKNNINAQGMCKYYVAGKCNYGGTCRFPHDVMSAMAYQQANYGLTNGSPHPRTPQPQAQSDVDTLTETMDNVHLQSPPSSSRQRRNKSGSSSPSQQVCRYYHQGTCRFGDQCKFQHIEMTNNPSTSTSSTSTSTSIPTTYNDGDKLGTSNMDRQHVWKSLQITEKSSDIIDTTSSIPSSHTLIIYHSRFSSTHTFMDLVQHEHDACIAFLHDLIEFLENVHGIMDYSIRIEQTVATEEEREECKEGDSSNINPTGSFRVRVLYGGDLSNATTRTTPASDQLSKTLIHTTPHNRIWFDYHGRSALIITPQSHVERPSQLDDTQLYALLCDPITQLRREYEHVLAKSRRDEEEGEHELKEMNTPRRLPPMTFQHLIINVGGYRRIRDLHIKMTLDPSLFTLITATWPAALQQRWNAAQQSANTSNETTTTANNAGKKKPIKSASANKENRKSITNGTAPTTSGKGKSATILPQQQQQQQTNGQRGWASIVNKTTSTTPATTIAPSILPTSSYTNTSSSESSTSSSPNASPMTATRR